MKTPSLASTCTMIRYRLLLSLCLASSSAALSACSVVVDSDRVQCKTDTDCTSRGAVGSICSNSVCQPDPTWSCLAGGANDDDPTGTVHVAMSMTDLLSGKPVAGVSLTLCAKLDANCDFRLNQFESDPAGQLDVELPAGFDGYFQTEGGGVYPTMFFPPNTRKQRAPSDLPMVPTNFFPTMFSQISGPVASDRSVILTTALDCRGKPAAGMLLASPQMDERTVSYVLEGGLPSHTATVTNETGAGGFVNIKAGSAVVTSTIAATGQLAGTVAVQTRPGHLSMVLVVPTGG